MEHSVLRPQAEQRYKEELDALRLWDEGNRKPENWRLSPKAVRLFILGSPKPVRCGDKEILIRKKYLGNDALVERCIVTLAGNRGLMLVGEPGTAKTMLSELLAAAISGCSTNTVQGTAGTTEDMIKYSWNYALLLADGPSRRALVPAPLYVGMEKGILTRFEEITRTPAELLAVTYHELREGISDRGQRIEKPSAVMSTAEAVSVYFQTLMTAWYYGDGHMEERCLVENLVGAVAKESREDMDRIEGYFSTVVRNRAQREGGAWTRYYEARNKLRGPRFPGKRRCCIIRCATTARPAPGTWNAPLSGMRRTVSWWRGRKTPTICCRC